MKDLLKVIISLNKLIKNKNKGKKINKTNEYCPRKNMKSKKETKTIKCLIEINTFPVNKIVLPLQKP